MTIVWMLYVIFGPIPCPHAESCRDRPWTLVRIASHVNMSTSMFGSWVNTMLLWYGWHRPRLKLKTWCFSMHICQTVYLALWILTFCTRLESFQQGWDDTRLWSNIATSRVRKSRLCHSIYSVKERLILQNLYCLRHNPNNKGPWFLTF
jgi:hypothetical protein